MNKSIRPSIFKRLLALILDFIVLALIGYVSGLFLEDFYVSLGKYGSLWGSAIVIVYFSILQSNIGFGQTLGKRAIGAKVTDLNGQYLSLGSSFLRALILVFPIMNVEILSGGNGILVIITILIFSLFASVYFALVNKSRRCLHDILVGSIVIKKDVSDFQLDSNTDKSPRKLIPLAVIATLMLSFSVYQSLAENSLSELLDAKKKIEAVNGVITVNEVQSNTTTYYHTNPETTSRSYIKLTVRVNDESEINLESRYFDEFYKIVKSEIPETENLDGVVITLYYGYNIGIASKTQSVTKTMTGLEIPGI